MTKHYNDEDDDDTEADDAPTATVMFICRIAVAVVVDIVVRVAVVAMNKQKGSNVCVFHGFGKSCLNGWTWLGQRSRL